MRGSALMLQPLDLPKTVAVTALLIAFVAVIAWLIAAHTDWLTYE